MGLSTGFRFPAGAIIRLSASKPALRPSLLATGVKRLEREFDHVYIYMYAKVKNAWNVTYKLVGETGSSRHSFQFRIFHNLYIIGTEMRITLIACAILGLHCSVQRKHMSNNVFQQYKYFPTSASV